MKSSTTQCEHTNTWKEKKSKNEVEQLNEITKAVHNDDILSVTQDLNPWLGVSAFLVKIKRG